MTAPLTTRDALAEVLAQHDGYGGNRFCECLPTDEDGCREPLGVSWEQHLVDALLTSGALTDATKLAAVVAAAREHVSAYDNASVDWWPTSIERLRDALAAPAAQSERAEVER